MSTNECRECDGFKNVEVWLDDDIYRVEKCGRCFGTGKDPEPPIVFSDEVTTPPGQRRTPTS